MYLYIIFFLLLFCTSISLYKIKGGYSHKKVFICFILFLFFLSAFRYERGCDWLSYSAYFKHCTSWGFDGWMEPGYTALNKCIALLTTDYSFMVFVVAVIIYLFKSITIYKLSPYPLVALCIWYTISIADVFPTRQSIANSIALFSVLFIVRRRFLPFVFGVVLASSFHLTALVFIVSYFIYSLKLSTKCALILFCASFCIALFTQGIVERVLLEIPSPLIQERMEAYLAYGADNTFGSVFSTREILIRGFVNRGMIVLFVLSLLHRVREKDSVLNFWINMFLFAGVFFFLLSSVNVALGRLVIYFDLSQIFLFPYLFTLKMSSKNKKMIFIVVALYLLYRFNGVVNNYYDLYIPYKGLFWNRDLSVELY